MAEGRRPSNLLSCCSSNLHLVFAISTFPTVQFFISLFFLFIYFYNFVILILFFLFIYLYIFIILLFFSLFFILSLSITLSMDLSIRLSIILLYLSIFYISICHIILQIYQSIIYCRRPRRPRTPYRSCLLLKLTFS